MDPPETRHCLYLFAEDQKTMRPNEALRFRASCFACVFCLWRGRRGDVGHCWTILADNVHCEDLLLGWFQVHGLVTALER